MDDSVLGTEVDGYRIQEVLGRGGMGVVYKAEDVALSRDVALKRIDPSMANDEAFLRRFRSEAQALARVDSPYIVSVHALRQTDIGLLIVMEFVEGGTVQDLIDEGPMDWQEALPVIEQMLKALEHAHGADVIHRDIKPQNVMLSTERRVKVTDFGLAKVHRPDSNKTVTQGVFGTLNYMSPEQVQGSADLDHRSDLYSLGMTIYEMLAGDLPFDDDSNEFTKMRRIVEEELPRPDALHAGVPDNVSALVMKSLEKDPDDRFQSAREMREAFEEVKRASEEEMAPAPSSRAHEDREPTPPASESEFESLVSTGWQTLTAGAVFALLLAGGGVWVLGGVGGTGTSGGGGATSTQFALTTQPDGATVLIDGNRVGKSPLSDTTLDGSTAQIQLRKAGFVPVDTLVQLAGRTQLQSHFPLRRKEASITLRSEPSARVRVDGTALGETPQTYATRKGTVRVQFEREGYQRYDTTLTSVSQLGQTELVAALEPDAEPSSPVADNGADNGDDNSGTSASFGTLALGATPSDGNVTFSVDGESGESGSIRVESGRHRIEISHPEYGRCDTTVTVPAEQTQELTCYFEHDVDLRSTPWAQIYLDGENTQESTNHTMRLKTGDTYEIGTRITSRSYEVTGGTYRRVATESFEVVAEEEFEGSTKEVTLRPTFEPITHGLEFRTKETESTP